MLATHNFTYGGDVIKNTQQFGDWVAAVEEKFGLLMARKLVLDVVHRTTLRIWPQALVEIGHPFIPKAQSKTYMRLIWGLMSGHIAKDNELALNSFRAASQELNKDKVSKIIHAMGCFACVVESDSMQYAAPLAIDELYKAYVAVSNDPFCADFWMAVSADAQFVMAIDPHGPVIWPRLWPKDLSSPTMTQWRNFKKGLAATGNEAEIRSWHFFTNYYDHLLVGQPQNMSPLSKICEDDHIGAWQGAVKAGSPQTVAAALTEVRARPTAGPVKVKVKNTAAAVEAERRAEALTFLNRFGADITRMANEYIAQLKVILTDRKVNPPRFKSEAHLKRYQLETQLLVGTYKSLAAMVQLTFERTAFEESEAVHALKIYDTQVKALNSYIAAHPKDRHRSMLCLAMQAATFSLAGYLGQSIGDH